jgi:hypothetical protein
MTELSAQVSPSIDASDSNTSYAPKLRLRQHKSYSDRSDIKSDRGAQERLALQKFLEQRKRLSSFSNGPALRKNLSLSSENTAALTAAAEMNALDRKVKKPPTNRAFENDNSSSGSAFSSGDDSDDFEEIFDPSMVFVAIHRCYYWSSRDRIRKGKLFFTKHELLFKCSRMPFVKVKIKYDNIECVEIVDNYKNIYESVLTIKRKDGRTFVFYKFLLPKRLIKNLLLQLIKENQMISHYDSDNENEITNSHLLTLKKMSKPITNVANLIKANSIRLNEDNDSISINNDNIKRPERPISLPGMLTNSDVDRKSSSNYTSDQDPFDNVEEAKPKVSLIKKSLRQLKKKTSNDRMNSLHGTPSSTTPTTPSSPTLTTLSENEIASKKVSKSFKYRKNIKSKIQQILSSHSDHSKDENKENASELSQVEERLQELKNAAIANADVNVLNRMGDFYTEAARSVYDENENDYPNELAMYSPKGNDRSFSGNTSSQNKPNNSNEKSDYSSRYQQQQQQQQRQQQQPQSNVNKTELSFESNTNSKNNIIKFEKAHLNIHHTTSMGTFGPLLDANQYKSCRLLLIIALLIMTSFLVITIINFSKLDMLEKQINEL